MDSYRVIITPRAGADLDRIYDRISENTPDAARAMIARILESLHTLKSFPHRTWSSVRVDESATLFDRFQSRRLCLFPCDRR